MQSRLTVSVFRGKASSSRLPDAVLMGKASNSPLLRVAVFRGEAQRVGYLVLGLLNPLGLRVSPLGETGAVSKSFRFNLLFPSGL